MKEETIQNIIETFRGDYNMGSGFRTTSEWVRKHDEVMFNNLIDKLWEFVADGSTSEDDIREFEAGNWLVEYRFIVDDLEETIMVYVTAGENREVLSTQPEWVEDYINIHDLEEDYILLPVFKYLEKLD